MNHRVLLGLMPISCEMLIYERADGRGHEHQRHVWPDQSARLAEQMLKANGEPMAGLKCSIDTGTANWTDVTGSFPVNAVAIGLHVDRAAIAAMLSRRISSVAAATTKSDHPNVEAKGEVWPKSGRPPGTTQYPTDPAIVDRVIALCDAKSFNGPARVTHALKSLMADIEPRGGSDDSKLKRLRPKVFNLRPDLRS